MTAAPTKAAATTSTKPATTTAAPASGAATAETTAAPAGPTDEQKAAARTAFEAGTKAYDEGNYAVAEEEFKKAEAAIPSPHAEYWIASSIDKQNKEPTVVVAAYETFLSNPGAQYVGEEKLNEAKARTAELKKTLPAKYTFVTTPAGAQVSIDGAPPAGVTPLTTELTPGKHKIEVSLQGYDQSLVEIEVEGGSLVEQPITLTQSAAPAAETPVPAAATEPTAERSMVPAYVTLGLGAAGLIAGTVFGILALDAKSQYDARPSESKADEVERNALICDMSFGVALTLGITGVVLLTSEEPKAEAPATARHTPRPAAKSGRLIVAPFASPTSGGAAARMTF